MTSRIRRIRAAAPRAMLVLLAAQAACSRDSAPALDGAHASAASSTGSGQAIPARSASSNIEVADVF